MANEIQILMRLDSEGEAVAFMPLEPGTNDPYNMTCYAHIGQHGTASMDYYRSTKPANIHDSVSARELWRELISIYETDPDPVSLRLIYRMPSNAIEIRREKIARV